MTTFEAPTEVSKATAWATVCLLGLYMAVGDRGYREASTTCIWLSHDPGGMRGVGRTSSRACCCVGMYSSCDEVALFSLSTDVGVADRGERARKSRGLGRSSTFLSNAAIASACTVQRDVTSQSQKVLSCLWGSASSPRRGSAERRAD